jgi:hypothetical protein
MQDAFGANYREKRINDGGGCYFRHKRGSFGFHVAAAMRPADTRLASA